MSALKGFQCMAVYAQPGSSAEATASAAADAQSADTAAAHGKASKKRKHAAAEAASASASSSSSSSPLLRYLYYKPHVSTASSADDSIKVGCTLFVVNIPFFYTSEHLTQLFAAFGTVEQVSFLQQGAAAALSLSLDRVGAVQPASFYRSAHVVYDEAESVDMAAKTDLSRMPQQCPEEEEDEQNTQVDRFMEGFDARTAAEKAAARSGGPTVDADGWTMVKSTGRNTKRNLMAREEETARAAETAAKKARKNTVVHFYKHQEREIKKERLVQLREKFEQDKIKIAKMKADRKFKPY